MRWASLQQVYEVVAEHPGLNVRELTALLYPGLSPGDEGRARCDTSTRLNKLKSTGRIIGIEYMTGRMTWRASE